MTFPILPRTRPAWGRPRSKMGHVSACNMCMSVKKDILWRTSTRNTAKSPDKDLVVGVHCAWTTSGTAVLITSKNMAGLGVRDRNGTLDKGLDTKHDVFVI
jgi:hypothetical protein